MDYARMLLPAAMRKNDEDFTIDLAITANNLQFGVQPYWNAGGYCNIDWGDGSTQAATTSGTQLTHTYASAGSYRVKVRGDMYRFRVGSTNSAAVIDCNGNWGALGDITIGTDMFHFCTNVRLPSPMKLPASLINGDYMFADCLLVGLAITELPVGLTGGYSMLARTKAAIEISALPVGLFNIPNMFRSCANAVFSLDDFVANNPGQWSSLAIIYNFAENVPGVTGHIASFLRKCPLVRDVGNAFTGTNATTFGDGDYFEITLTTTEANQSWGFTATSSAGRWYCFDWGDGTAVTSNKNLAVFTSGTKVSHTFATPGTYHIKLATAPCSIVFDPYDSDNGNWAALGQ